MKTLTLSLSVLVLALSAGCAKHGEPVAPSVALPPVKARVQVLQAQDLPALTELSGTVLAFDRATLASKVMGVVAELPVSLGQRVNKGELLVRINAAEIGARLAQARSQLNLAQRDLARERELFLKQATSAEMVRSLEDRHTMALEQVREAEAMLAYTEIRAPFDGVIARKPINAGDLASPGMPLLELEGSNRFEIEVRIPESLASSLKPGVSAGVEIPSLGLRFDAVVRELSPASDIQSRNVLAKLEVPAGLAVRSGHFARVSLVTGRQQLLLISQDAVRTQGQMELVFVLKEGHACLRLVRTGLRRGSDVELLSGVAEGEQVLITGSRALVEGQAVEVQP